MRRIAIIADCACDQTTNDIISLYKETVNTTFTVITLGNTCNFRYVNSFMDSVLVFEKGGLMNFRQTLSIALVKLVKMYEKNNEEPPILNIIVSDTTSTDLISKEAITLLLATLKAKGWLITFIVTNKDILAEIEQYGCQTLLENN